MRYTALITLLLMAVVFATGQSMTDFSKQYIDTLYQVSSEIQSLQSRNNNFQDLEPIGRSIGEADIVLLGEPSHGDGGSMQMKNRLVKYLHQKKGFDVLLFEADLYAIMYAVATSTDPHQIINLAKENIYTCWTESQVSQDLWNYYIAQLESNNPIHLGGFDVRHAGHFSKTRLVQHLDSILTSLDFNITSKNHVRFNQDLNYLLQNEFTSKKDTVDSKNFLEQLTKIEQTIGFSSLPSSERNLLSIEINNIKNLHAYLIEGKNRDILMAENFILLSKYIFPGKKIMVWSHNNHNALDVNTYASYNPNFAKEWYKNNTYQSFTYFGSDLFREFGKRVYSLAITSGEGNYSPAFFGKDYFHADFSKIAQIPASGSGSLEKYLQQKNSGNRFIPLPRAQGRPSGYPWFSSRLLDLTYEAKMDYTSSFHGIIYLEKTVDLNGE